MSVDRALWRWVWPRFDQVFVLELLLSVAIISVAAGVALAHYADAVFKAKLTEAFVAAAHGRAEIVERLALSGDPVETPLEGAQSIVAASAEAYLAGQKTVEAKKDRIEASLRDLSADEQGKRAQQRESAAETGRGGTSRYVASLRTVGNSVVVAGSIDGRPYELALYPAVADEENPGVYIWLCGNARIPEGWLAQPPALSRHLPNHLLPMDCKRRRSE